MLSDRQKELLKTIIEEHIKMAEPVGSQAIAGLGGFDIGAAMLRKEMSHLEREGYLAKPHTSAGRVPTDKAYRFYIQEELAGKAEKTDVAGKVAGEIEKPTAGLTHSTALNSAFRSADGKRRSRSTPSATQSEGWGVGGLTSRESQKISKSLKQNWPDEQTLLKEISHLASDMSKELSVSGLVGGENSYSFGFSNLFDEPEFRSFDCVNQLMHFMDNVDMYFDKLWEQALGESLNVFIGGESSIKEINEFTLITGKYQLPEGEQGFVSVIGPKRMNYKRNMALVEYISKMVEGMR